MGFTARRHMVWIAGIIALVAATLPRPASAGVLIYHYVMRDHLYPAVTFMSGELITMDTTVNGNAHEVIGMTGTHNGSPIALLAPGSFLGNDNLLITNPYGVTYNGISYAAGGISFNIYDGSLSIPLLASEQSSTGGHYAYYIDVSFVSAVEPVSAALFGTGLLTLIGIRRATGSRRGAVAVC